MLNFSRYRIKVLCEDTRHFLFVKGFLGAGPRDGNWVSLYTPCPDGTRSGEQHVREYFPKALKEIRSTSENIFLIVVMDVDRTNATPITRKNELNKTLHGWRKKINDRDKLLLLLPKRNIETWFEWLDAGPVAQGQIDETKDYKERHRKAKAKAYGKKLRTLHDEMSRRQSACEMPPNSIAYACNAYELFCEMMGRY